MRFQIVIFTGILLIWLCCLPSRRFICRFFGFDSIRVLFLHLPPVTAVIVQQLLAFGFVYFKDRRNRVHFFYNPLPVPGPA
ncbi:MAG: hypothetical protein JWQ40_1555 [Segetibacter sp.]|nr:hypothetical protein [Segetibacter sp.]